MRFVCLTCNAPDSSDGPSYTCQRCARQGHTYPMIAEAFVATCALGHGSRTDYGVVTHAPGITCPTCAIHAGVYRENTRADGRPAGPTALARPVLADRERTVMGVA